MKATTEFLKEIKNKEPDQHFLLYQFYNMPDSSLGGSKEETIEEYYKYGNIKHLIVNNTFFDFLELCLEDESFYQKLDYNLLRKLRFLIYDSKQFVENYITALEDPYLREWCRDKVPLGPIYSKKYNIVTLMGIIETYSKVGWIYELELSSERIKQYDQKKASNLLYQVGSLLDMYYQLNIQPEEERKEILRIIKTDDYQDPDSCFLALRNGSDKKVFLNLTCDNEFLKIVEEDLLPQDLPEFIRRHIIEVLTISINFRMLNKIYANFDLLYQMLGKEKIMAYDYNKAKELIASLEKKKNQKIIRFCDL